MEDFKCLVFDCVLMSSSATAAKIRILFFFFTVTHQVISCSVHLHAPLDGAVKPLVVYELLLNGSRIVPPGSSFDEALEQQTGRKVQTFKLKTFPNFSLLLLLLTK